MLLINQTFSNSITRLKQINECHQLCYSSVVFLTYYIFCTTCVLADRSESVLFFKKWPCWLTTKVYHHGLYITASLRIGGAMSPSCRGFCRATCPTGSAATVKERMRALSSFCCNDHERAGWIHLFVSPTYAINSIAGNSALLCHSYMY